MFEAIVQLISGVEYSLKVFFLHVSFESTQIKIRYENIVILADKLFNEISLIFLLRPGEQSAELNPG